MREDPDTARPASRPPSAPRPAAPGQSPPATAPAVPTPGLVAGHAVAVGRHLRRTGRRRAGPQQQRPKGLRPVDGKSIQTRRQRRDGALRSKFLDAGNHPAITFTSTKVEQAGDTSFAVTGDLTIRGVTRPVTVDFKLTGARTDPRGTFRAGFAGSATINRKDWGVNWTAA
jgi:YceI-like protein